MKTYKILHQSAVSTASGLIILMTLTSCKENGGTVNDKSAKIDSTTGREEGITISIEDADLVQVDSSYRFNTAKWNLSVKNPGRYNVWLSSLTCDTLHLSYKEKVTLTADDAWIKKRPMGDEIVTNDPSVKELWYRANSHKGSVFFSKPGEYQVQGFSDGVMPHASDPPMLTDD